MHAAATSSPHRSAKGTKQTQKGTKGNSHRIVFVLFWSVLCLLWVRQWLQAATRSSASVAAHQTDRASASTTFGAILPNLPSALDETLRQPSGQTVCRPNRPIPAPPLRTSCLYGTRGRS